MKRIIIILIIITSFFNLNSNSKNVKTKAMTKSFDGNVSGNLSFVVGDNNTLKLGGGTLSDGAVHVWNTDFGPLNKNTIDKIEITGNIIANTSLENFFKDFGNVREIVGFEKVDTSKTTNMKQMFQNCTSLTSINLSNINTSNVTNMFAMFNNCNKIKNITLSKFDTSNVTNMNGIFYDCHSIEYLDLSTFDTSKLVLAGYMNLGANASLKTLKLGTKIDLKKTNFFTRGKDWELPYTKKWVKTDKSKKFDNVAHFAQDYNPETDFGTYTREYQVTFDTNGGTNTPLPFIAIDGDKVPKPADPIKENSKFLGWVDVKNNIYDFDTILTTPVKLIAQYRGLTYSFNGVPENKIILFMPKTFEKPKITFSSSSSNGVNYNVFQTGDVDTTKVGTYTCYYEVILNGLSLEGKYYVDVVNTRTINGVTKTAEFINGEWKVVKEVGVNTQNKINYNNLGQIIKKDKINYYSNKKRKNYIVFLYQNNSIISREETVYNKLGETKSNKNGKAYLYKTTYVKGKASKTTKQEYSSKGKLGKAKTYKLLTKF